MRLEEAEALARVLMAKHGLTGWRFVWTRAVHEFGVTRWDRRTIGLSRRLTELNPRDEVRDTILHEIAHAEVGPMAARHGVEWRMAARKVGARPQARYRDHVQVIPVPRRWIGRCPGCGRTYPRHRRLTRAFCRHCGAQDGRLIWEENPEWN